MLLFETPQFIQEAVPGRVKTIKASSEGRRVVVASRAENPANDPDAESWHVSYLRLHEAKDTLSGEAGGWRAEVRYHSAYLEDDAFGAGMKFGELAAKLPADDGSAPRYLSEDPLEQMAFAKDTFEKAYSLAESQVMWRLKCEAAKLKEKKTSYPPEESELGQILGEIGALPE